MQKGKGLKAAALIGALAPMYAGVAMAQLPSGFAFGEGATGGYTQSGTDITYNCPTGWNCSTIAQGANFVQFSIAETGGTNTYIKTIVTDPTQGFVDESYVKMVMNLGGTTQNNENGIVGRQTIAQTGGVNAGAGVSFDSTTNIASGWGLAAGGPAVDIVQNLEDTGNATTVGDDFVANFIFKSNVDAQGTPTGFSMDIHQLAGLAQGGGAQNVNDVQVFSLRQRDGDMSPGNGGNVGFGAASTATLPYAAGDNMKVVWLGQSVNLGDATADPNALGDLFGYQSYENLDQANGTGDNRIAHFSLFEAGPWGWDTSLGAAPCLTATNKDATGATC